MEQSVKTIAFACDHGGFLIKDQVVRKHTIRANLISAKLTGILFLQFIADLRDACFDIVLFRQKKSKFAEVGD